MVRPIVHMWPVVDALFFELSSSIFELRSHNNYWNLGASSGPKLRDLCPSDMTPLSRAPALEVKGPKYQLAEKQEKKKDVTDELFSRFVLRGRYNFLFIAYSCAI
jgi:hypothetical protein